MEAKVSEISLIVQYTPVSTLHQALIITHFSDLTSYMGLLSIKKIFVTSLEQNKKVYNVLRNDRVGKSVCVCIYGHQSVWYV